MAGRITLQTESTPMLLDQNQVVLREILLLFKFFLL
jgi:hypothetical protein